jgi:serine O-acetyltransferase
VNFMSAPGNWTSFTISKKLLSQFADRRGAGVSHNRRVFGTIKEQVETIFREDPAAKSIIEIVLCYPGLHAILLHRLAHWLHNMGVPLVPRVISQTSRFLTGVDIRPGARIGRRFFIDHGMGVVIGETAEIGDDVLLYQGVTLGGTGNEKGKRHPTLGNHVVVGSGAKVLGSITLGNHVKIGAGSVVVKPVPDHCTVVGIPGRIVKGAGAGIATGHELDHGALPDLEMEETEDLRRRVSELEAVVRNLADRRITPDRRRLGADESVNGELTID